VLKKIHLSRLAMWSAVCAFSALTLNSSLAQQSNAAASQSGLQPLPPVVVNQPEARRRATVAAPRRAQRASQSASSRKPPQPRAAAFVENPRGAIRG
jgi:iron complex outermembrane receptor protein